MKECLERRGEESGGQRCKKVPDLMIRLAASLPTDTRDTPMFIFNINIKIFTDIL